MPQQKFEDHSISAEIAYEKRADQLKAQFRAEDSLEAEQQDEDRKITKDIEAEKRKSQKKHPDEQRPKPKGKARSTKRRKK
jgi:hypothetical protein